MSDFRTLPADREVSKHKRFVDTRSGYETLKDVFLSFEFSFGILALLNIVAFFEPIAAPLVIILDIILVIYLKLSKKNKTLPIKLPIHKFEGVTDYNQNKPGSRKEFDTAQGTVLIGNCMNTGAEVWGTGADFLTHLLYIASTGGGKTDGLVSLSGATSFTMGGGLIYVDAKAAADLIFQFVSLARLVGREHQLRFINYRTGNKSVKERHWKKLSNTNAPFSHGNSSVCVQIIEGVMPESDPGSQYFKDRGLAALSVVLPALCELRDEGLLNISPGLIAQMAEIPAMIKLAYPEHFSQEIQYRYFGTIEDVTIPNILSRRTIEGLRMYLRNLPNFSEDPKVLVETDGQHEQVNVQHGFGKGYFLKALANISLKYGHIYEHEVGEADFTDCMLNNRILIVMIPATQESKEERQTLGKINLSAIRVTMSLGLGPESEGDVEDVISNLPIDKKTPSMMIIDEYAEAAVPGFAVTATQGRGLGMACCFAGQDLAGFIAANKEETDMIFGSTRMKMLGVMLDVNETWDRFKKLAGTMTLTKSGGYKGSEGLGVYDRDLNTNIEEIDRLDIRDLLDLVEGEVQVFWRNKIILTSLFHYGIDHKKVNNFRFNRLLHVRAPSKDEIEKIEKKIDKEYLFLDSVEDGFKPLENTGTNFFSSVNVKQDTDWIYQLLDKDISKIPVHPIANAKTEPQKTSSYKPATNDEKSKADLSALLESSSVGSIASEPNKSSDVDSKSIEGVIKAPAHGWIFGYEVSKNTTNQARRIHKGMTTALVGLGVDVEPSSRMAAKTINSITDSVKYTSEEVIPKGDDKKKIWLAIKDLDEI